MNLSAIRKELPRDETAIRDLDTAAFGRPVEAGWVVGHVLFFPMPSSAAGT